jgi:predicted component of type VI protein secretion system
MAESKWRAELRSLDGAELMRRNERERIERRNAYQAALDTPRLSSFLFCTIICQAFCFPLNQQPEAIYEVPLVRAGKWAYLRGQLILSKFPR